MGKQNSKHVAPKSSILIIDDEKTVRDQLSWSLRDEFTVFLAAGADEALACIQEHNPDVVTLDLNLSVNGNSTEGFDVLDSILNESSSTLVIVVTGLEDKEYALKAINAGAHDYFLKPFDIDELRTIIRRSLSKRKLEEKNKLRFYDTAKRNQFEEIISKCPAMMNVFDTIRRVAPKDVNVLIYGESGTGKELVARAIHNLSHRHMHPLVVINCGAIPDNLLEAELFGHEKGAFTGAHILRKGKFEIANHGTIFLDEIAELSLPLQVKLLRVLQEKTIERVGGRELIELDVTVITATNKNLEEEIKKGSFRDDLFYRLCVIKIDLPPLRDRGDDISLLSEYFLTRSVEEFKSKVRGLTIEAKSDLLKYNWPGNIRELENEIKRAVIMSQAIFIQSEDLNLQINNAVPRRSLRERVAEVEKQSIEDALSHSRGNLTKAANELQINRTTFYDLVRKHEISTKKYR